MKGGCRGLRILRAGLLKADGASEIGFGDQGRMFGASC